MLMMVNADNVGGEIVPHIIEELMNLGVANVHVIPAITKKGRPEFIFLIDTEGENLEAIGDFLVREIGTLGVRLFEETRHMKFDYEMRKVRLIFQGEAPGLVLNVKVVRDSGGSIASARVEYEDLKAAVNSLSKVGVDVSMPALRKMIETSVLNGEGKTYQNLSVELVS